MIRRLNRLLLPCAISALLLNGCGGRAINKKTARDVILGSRAGALKERDLGIVSVTQASPGEAIVETDLRTAFRLVKVGKEWQVREVRVGDGSWVKMDDLLRAILQVKIDETRALLERIASAIEAYRQKNGSLPKFKDYVQLSDALSPLYLSPVVRLDPWGNPLSAMLTAPNTVLLISAGPDGKLGTADDIRLSREFTTTGGKVPAAGTTSR